MDCNDKYGQAYLCQLIYIYIINLLIYSIEQTSTFQNNGTDIVIIILGFLDKSSHTDLFCNSDQISLLTIDLSHFLD